METAQKGASLLTREVLYAYAAEQARRGDYVTAERLLTQLRNAGETHADLFLLLGKVWAQQGRYQDAEAAWRVVL